MSVKNACWTVRKKLDNSKKLNNNHKKIIIIINNKNFCKVFNMLNFFFMNSGINKSNRNDFLR